MICWYDKNLTEVSRWTSWLESISRFLSQSSRMRNRELNLGVMELSNIVSSTLFSLQRPDINNLNVRVRSTMSSSHILEQLLNSTSSSGISKLLPHIMLTLLASIPKQDSKVLNFLRFLLKNLTINHTHKHAPHEQQ